MELFRLLGTIAIDNTEANRAINETTENANNASDEVSGAFEKIGGVAGRIATGIGVAGAAIGGAFIATIESTREYRREMGLLEAAYLTAGHSSESAKDTYSELNAVMADSGAAVEAAQHLSLVADNEAELNELTHTLTGVYATFGASLPLESLSEAINHSSSLGEVQGSLADALEWSGITVDDFNAQLAECSTEEERQDLIMRTLKDTYGEAADQYKETNKDVMEAEQANERLADAMADIGAIGEPIMTRIKESIAGMVETAVPKIESFIGKLKDIVTWVKNNEDTVQKWVGVILGATVAIGTFLLILNWGVIMTAAANAVKVVRTAILAMNAAMLANPIALIVSLIAGLVVAFIYLWNNCESFRNFWINLWDKLKAAGSVAIDAVKKKFDAFKDALSTVKSVFGQIKDTITEKIESARSAVDKAIQKIKGFFNITLKFKGISMPDISIAWKKSPAWMYEAAKLIGLEGVPKFSVKWNAEGAVLTKPTIFGRMNDTFLGGGEDGAEAIAPIDVLQGYTREAVAEGMNTAFYELITNTRTIIALLGQLLQRSIYLDSGALVGELAPLMDDELGNIEARRLRGNI